MPRLVHGEIGQNLAVHFDARQSQTVDELRIAQIGINQTHGSVDPLDPERAEVTLARLAVAGCVLVGLVDRLRGSAEIARARGVIAFRLLQHFLVRGVGDFPDLTRDIVQVSRSAVVGHVFLHDLRIRFAQHHGACGVADEFRGAFDHAVALAGVTDFDLAEAVNLNRFFAADFVFILGIYSSFSGCESATRHATLAGRVGLERA